MSNKKATKKKVSSNTAKAKSQLLTKGEKTMKTKEFYSVKEVAENYGKDESHVRKELKRLNIDTVMAKSKSANRPIQAMSQKAYVKLTTAVKWIEKSLGTDEITVIGAMKELGLHVENQRKTFKAKLALLKITTSNKNVGKGKAQPCFDKKHMKELKKIFDIPNID